MCKSSCGCMLPTHSSVWSRINLFWDKDSQGGFQGSRVKPLWDLYVLYCLICLDSVVTGVGCGGINGNKIQEQLLNGMASRRWCWQTGACVQQPFGRAWEVRQQGPCYQTCAKAGGRTGWLRSLVNCKSGLAIDTRVEKNISGNILWESICHMEFTIESITYFISICKLCATCALY